MTHYRTQRSFHARAGFAPVALFLLTLMALGTASACARVKPYERGRLAAPDMQFDGDADLMSGQNHAIDYREGSAGGYGGGGGGCGCN